MCAAFFARGKTGRGGRHRNRGVEPRHAGAGVDPLVQVQVRTRRAHAGVGGNAAISRQLVLLLRLAAARHVACC